MLNLYPDGNCACKYHSDPDHGKLWYRDTVIVSVGETRRFNLRKIVSGKKVDRMQLPTPHSFHVRHGDVFHMYNNCQDEFQHCIMASEGKWNDGPRASIVFKKSIPQMGGRRGHGIGTASKRWGNAKNREDKSIYLDESTPYNRVKHRHKGRFCSNGTINSKYKGKLNRR